MALERNKLGQVKGFFGSLVSRIKEKALAETDLFYSIVLGVDHDGQCVSLQSHQQNQQQQQQLLQLKLQQFPQNQTQQLYPLAPKQHQQQPNNQTTSIIQQPPKPHHPSKPLINNIPPHQPHPAPHFHTRKLNPRHQKFIKIQKTTPPSTTHQQLSLQNQDLRRKEQLKVMNRKRLELREKLRKLNEELERERQKNSRVVGSGGGVGEVGVGNPEEELYCSKNSSFVTKIHHKSELQLVSRRKKSPNLAEKEEVYSQDKHAAAFKLIQKLHGQRLRKQQKMLNEMKNKQQRQLQAVQRLQQERYKQRQEKLDRQKIYYINTPKSKFSSKTRFMKAQTYNKSTLQNPSSNTTPPQPPLSKNPRKHNQSQLLPTKPKPFFNQPKKPQHDLLQQEITLIIPRQKEQQYIKKGQFLYTEEEFQPQTQEGKQFRQCLKKGEIYNQGQSVNRDLSVNEGEKQKLEQGLLRQLEVRQNQIIESKIKSTQSRQQDIYSQEFSQTKQLQLPNEMTVNQFA